jgi:hypothetical protein
MNPLHKTTLYQRKTSALLVRKIARKNKQRDRAIALLAPQMGKWLAAVAKKGPNEIVGDVLTEAQVRNLYDGRPRS